MRLTPAAAYSIGLVFGLPVIITALKVIMAVGIMLGMKP